MIVRSIWKGAISFGLVHIPIKLFAATEEKDVRFHLLHKECHNPIQYQKRCPYCDREVTPEEIVKGFEYDKGRYVIITQEELEGLAPEGSRSIDIQSFVALKEIDPIFFVKTYYLSPDQHGQKAYALLRNALRETDRLALARVILRTKEALVALRVYGKGLAMHTMLYPEEIRSMEPLGDLGESIEVSAKEQTMAVQLIESLTEPFDPVKWQSEQRERIRHFINAKVQGQAIVEAPQTPTVGKVIDLMEALKASIQQVKTQQKKEAAPKKERRRKTS
ncbi:Ku protein [Heliomicrobium modesticaldum]|uniref:Non-homologous end joining protein Ku n=1 Tax=Heliobacterium modesticaldum (strain ATCC 51547 / Ice1) TaxID=498761 RepID=KU_HELMI|nr:Ku protein [Heliomicrobium modesticaldum]B0TIF2.2 RecName: Full=Non-homologous end joining protein Ku [Heliomicrobium modesticaldum Ice1]